MAQEHESPDCFYLHTPSCPEQQNPFMKKFDAAEGPLMTARLTSRDYEEVLRLCEKCHKFKVFH